MNAFLVVLTLIFTALLITVAGIRLTPNIVSKFELKRRSGHDAKAQRLLEQEERLEAFTTILWLKTMVLLVLVIIFALAGFGWFWGVLYSLAVSLTFGAIARTAAIQPMSRWIWKKAEPWLVKALQAIQPVIKTLRTDSVVDAELYRRFDSRQELERLIERSGDILSRDERELLVHGLQFADVTVRAVMTPRAAIDSIKKGEFLGPLVLSELHDLGHSRLPVIDGDLDHIVGILHLRDLLSLHDKQSATAEKVMEPKVYYIHEDDGVEHALAAFIKTRRHLFVVINEQRETVGLLSLEDVIETLIGRKIMDENDNHEDLRAIATERGRSNNQPPQHIDL
jgi:CBS domain containing-hemolysin-like protein